MTSGRGKTRFRGAESRKRNRCSKAKRDERAYTNSSIALPFRTIITGRPLGV
jgi:hypothetical protein